MSLTVADVQTKSTLERVQALTPDQIQGLLDTCEVILESFGLNYSAEFFEKKYNAAELLLFEWLASNPNSLKSLTQGKLVENYNQEIPIAVRLALQPILITGFGSMVRGGGA